MVTFTDTRLYTRGICAAQLADMENGQILLSSDKFQEGNITVSVNADPLRAGLNNAVAAIIESDPDIQVNFTQANLDLGTKMAGVGGSVTYNAVAPVCQNVTADSAVLKADVSAGAPVAQYGMAKAFAYVQELEKASGIQTGGVAYEIGTDGTISGFTAVSGTRYKVWYFVRKLSAVCGEITSAMNGKVGLFTAQMPVYANVNAKTNEGTRRGWLYLHVPVKLTAETATVTGSQSNYDTTSIVGRAISMDEQVVSDKCDGCGSGGTLAWYVYVPDSDADVVTGVVTAIGGVINVPVSGTVQVKPQAVLANGQLAVLEPGQCTYELVTPPTGTTVSAAGVISAGAQAGDCDLKVSFLYAGQTFTDQCAVHVASA